MAKPKLALIPAAQGSDKLFSVLPSNGVGDFDFIRPSSATRINSKGLIEEVATKESRLNYPLIDGKAVGCPHHILEPERRNFISYSNNFSVSYWLKESFGTASDPVVTSNYSTSPDGSLNASRIVFNIGGTTSNDISQLEGSVVSNGGSITNSLWIKSNTDSSYNMSFVKPNGFYSSVLVTTEWQRFVISSSIAGVNSTLRLRLRGSENTSDTADVSVWGAQVEEGYFYPTSYIPTNGEANGVTRLEESADNAGNSQTFNSSEGVLMIEASALVDDTSERRFSLNDETSSNVVRIGYTSTSDRIVAVVYNGVDEAFLYDDYASIIQNNKILLKYKETDFALWINGFKASTDSGGPSFPEATLTNISFDDGSGGNKFYGKVKQVQYYDSALTDSELEQLTSWMSFLDMAQGQQYSIK